MNLGDSSYKLIHGLSRLIYCKICHICGCEGDRRTQGLFVCTHCGEYNADINGAINIAKKFERSLGYMPLDGYPLNMPLTMFSTWKPHLSR
jgi:hypothetical protein